MINWLTSILSNFLTFVLSVLPTSPFAKFMDALGSVPYLSWANWFVPIGTFISIGEAWLISIGLFYLYSVVLRWIKAIE